MKILIYDIETSPSMAYIWSCWQNNIPINMIHESGELLCWCAKWYGEKNVYSDTVWKSGIEGCVKSLHALIDEADAVVAHNGENFDQKVMNTMFIKYGLDPAAPAKMIDTLKVAKNRFRFLSNKLDYIAQYFGFGQKNKTDFDLWVRVLNGEKKAQREMLDYNVQDVLLLEKVYEKFIPWIKQHPNHALYQDDAETPVCTNCGSTHVHRKGFSYTKVGVYQRYKCQDCGTPLRGRYTQVKKNENVLTQEI